MKSQTVIDALDYMHLDLHKIAYISLGQYFRPEFSLEFNQHLCEIAVFLSNSVPDVDSLLMIIEKDFITPMEQNGLKQYTDFTDNPDSDRFIRLLQELSENIYVDIQSAIPEYELAFINTYPHDTVAEVYVAVVD